MIASLLQGGDRGPAMLAYREIDAIARAKAVGHPVLREIRTTERGLNLLRRGESAIPPTSLLPLAAVPVFADVPGDEAIVYAVHADGSMRQLYPNPEGP